MNTVMKQLTLVLIFTAALQAQPQPQSSQQESGPTIDVSEASYGKNRGNNQTGNATQYVKRACNGKRTCAFAVQNAAGQIGDHSPGQTKDFDVTYLCGDDLKETHVEGESVGKTALLTCAKK
jgi:hypothetical protein